MNSYESLAGCYDSLTLDVPYPDFADYYERLFAADGGEYRMLLDLCCGTGTLSCLLAERGYDMIAADASPDMLMYAREKAAGLSRGEPPLFICQAAAELDLYGTVDAAVSSLDSMNYVPPEDIPEVFDRLRLFIRPGGLLVFDIRTPEFLRSMDGVLSVDETDDVFCLWQGAFDVEIGALVYSMDIFRRDGAVWRRGEEVHTEYAHEPDWLRQTLEKAGFTDVAFRTDGPQGGDGRLFITAKRQQ